MSLTATGWKNKKGTKDRSCNCGSWKQHWINNTDKSWPKQCCIKECSNDATLGAHVINKDVSGEYIIPACDSCNQCDDEFELKGGITLVSANKQNTCEK